MDVFILRHGDAARQAKTDFERCLTARGQDELHQTLASLQDKLQRVSHVFASPYVRAQQTARIATDYLLPSVVTHTCELLVPEGHPSKVMDYLQHLQQHKDYSSVLLVSHQPLVGVLLDKLCGFEVGRYRMGTSAIVHVEAEVFAANMGHMHWLRQPSDTL